MWPPARRVARFALVALVLAAAPARAEPPQRIVSFNLCADQLVAGLADPGQIAGLSYFATDLRTSFVRDTALGFPRLPSRAEAAMRAGGDLVFVGPIDRSPTRKALERQGVRIVEVELVQDVTTAIKQIREIGALLGHPARAEALVQEIEAARARLVAARRDPPLTALAVEKRGYTAGSRSLLGHYLGEAGLAAPSGVPGGYGGFMPLERLLASAPDILVLSEADQPAEDQGSLYLLHPAVTARWPQARRLTFPERLWVCGGPAVPAALDHLARELARIRP